MLQCVVLPHGFAMPISCPPGTYTHNNSLTNSSECTPCDAGHFCPHNNSEPIPCPKGHIAPVEGHSSCDPCPVGYYAEELAQTQCIKCVEGVYCSLGTTIRPCDPGWFRNLTDSGCVPAYLGMYAAKGATEPTGCSAGSFANETGTPECPLCPAGRPARARPTRMRAVPCGRILSRGRHLANPMLEWHRSCHRRGSFATGLCSLFCRHLFRWRFARKLPSQYLCTQNRW